MKRVGTAILLLFVMLCGCGVQSGPRSGAIRPAAVAGQFYPADSTRLAKAVHAFLQDARPPSVDNPTALIIPHAGYIYSGQICADAFRQAQGHSYDLVVVLGTNHTMGGFNGAGLYDGSGFRTPLGVAEVDREAARALLDRDTHYAMNDNVHRQEHSIEVELPFVQVLFPKAKILPVVVSTSDPAVCASMGEALAGILKGRNALIVASSDLSHYPAFEDAKTVDRATLEAVETLDPWKVTSAIRTSMGRGVPNLATCACGEGAILTAMIAAKALGADTAAVISYANSGDTPLGDRSRVVGYGAVAIAGEVTQAPCDPFGPNQRAELPTPIPMPDRRALLALARTTIARYLTTETVPLPRGCDPRLDTPRGAFVTLTEDGVLRGCVGYMREDMPLRLVVSAMAMQAAFNDRRFSPLRLPELSRVSIEISVLTPYKQVSGPGDIVLGRDGVMIRKGDRSAVYLPQVAPEQGWTVEQTLNHLSLKAGLKEDAWKAGTDFYVFQADVFGEHDSSPTGR